MATIQSQLRLNDGMSAVLRQVTAALDMCIASYEELQSVSGQAMDITNMTAVRTGLAEATTSIDTMAMALQEVTNQQDAVNQTIQQGVGAADNLMTQIQQMAESYLSLQGLKNILGLSDLVASTQTKLSLIVDDGGSVADLEADIFASSIRARSFYLDTASVVASLSANAGNAFADNREVIAFMEQVNKQFVIGGTSAQAQSAAMLQLTQAMEAGTLRGEDLNSILENAPGIARAIESYMGVAEGSIQQYADAGDVTAEVVKNALFSVAEETNAMFAQMPMTWEQVWTGMISTAIFILQPLLSYINDLANDPRLQGLANGLLGALNAVVVVAVPLIDFLVDAATMIANNWDMIAPAILGIAGVLLFLRGAQIAYNVVMGITNGLKAVFAAYTAMTTIAEGAETTATFAATVAQHGFNAALLACPLTWILLIIIALIAVIYIVVAAINHFAGTSISATGVICGAFMVALAFIGNNLIALWNMIVDVFVLIYNLVATVANFIGNVFTDPIGAVCRLFFDLADTVLGVIQTLANSIDTVFGSNLAASVQGWRDSLGGWVDDTFGKGTEIMAKITADDRKLDPIKYDAVWNIGYSAGQGLDNKISDMFNPASLNNLLNPNNIPGAEDLIGGIGGMGGLDGMGGTLTDIADNTGSAAESLKQSDENLAFLRDVAEREAVNRFTTAEIRVEMVNHNALSSNMDLDGVVNLLEAKVTQSLLSCAEGVHV